MRVLIADQTFSSQKVLENVLAKVGSCHVVPDGEHALFAFRRAWSEGKPFQLVCIDLSIPKIDTNQALSKIREIEKEFGVKSASVTKVLYLSHDDSNSNKSKDPNVATASKPVDAKQLEILLRDFGLLGNL